MNKTDKYRYWLLLSDYDLDTIDPLIAAKRWVYVAFLCQQAVERQLKGLYVYYTNKEAPKTHNLNFLFSKIERDPAFCAGTDRARFTAEQQDCEDFLIDAMFYFMNDYPFSYKNIMNRFVDEKTALDLVRRTRYYIEWLRSFQPLPSPLPEPDPDSIENA